ncbi:hypothetical protein RIF29_09528 [Crotalaria pallida]|uniref:Uncharacterized protein n=1 Tax=Crotalaria pallida TaxID=3830 RepID=A0AAN9IKK7_CROPI
MVEVNDGSAFGIFILFDSDVNKLIKRTCSDLLSSSDSVASDDNYPAEFKSLIGRTLLFKVVNTAVGASSDSGVFKVRSVCDDSNIISMYQLSDINLSPSKAFSSSYLVSTAEDVPCNSSELEETSAFVSDLIATPVSLGDDHSDMIPSSSVKRKLEPEFMDDAVLSSYAKKRTSRASKKVVV